MKVAVTSDWHITKKSPETTNVVMLYEFLRWGEENLDHIVLNGDIFDTWARPWGVIKTSKLHNRVNQKIINKIFSLRKAGKLEYVVGNHDDYLESRFSLPLLHVIPHTDIICAHGHIWDKICYGPSRFLGEFGHRSLNLAEKLSGKDLKEFGQKFFYYVFRIKNLTHSYTPEGLDLYENEGRAMIEFIKNALEPEETVEMRQILAEYSANIGEKYKIAGKNFCDLMNGVVDRHEIIELSQLMDSYIPTLVNLERKHKRHLVKSVRGILKQVNGKGINRLVHSHTHRAAISDDGVLMNSGCCTEGRTDYILITDGYAELRRMTDGF